MLRSDSEAGINDLVSVESEGVDDDADFGVFDRVWVESAGVNRPCVLEHWHIVLVIILENEKEEGSTADLTCSFDLGFDLDRCRNLERFPKFFSSRLLKEINKK
jgi:hypothetical protein